MKPEGLRILCWVVLALLLTPLRDPAADNTSAPATNTTAEVTNSQELLRSYLQLQEQLHANQLAIEQGREEAKAATARSAEVLAARLQGIEQALAAQRARELEAMQSSNRVMLIVAGTFAGIGFLAMLLMAFFQWRTIHGLAEISAALPATRALGPPPALAALGPGDAQLLSGGSVEESNLRLLGALEQLQKRIAALEHPLRQNLPAANIQPAVEPAPHANGAQPPSNGATAAPSAGSDNGAGRAGVKTLLIKGQSLLDGGQAEAALAAFEEALTLDGQNPEIFIKKGTALEKLERLDAAIACYDQAIAADASLTIAYLHKGGLCNRLERFTEALACYEKALHTQEKQSTRA
jgi:tetratricopeptide (TPR) repeat protein